MFTNIRIPVSTKIVLKDSKNECRICLENDGKELIYPCKCKFPVHKKCLIKWLKSDANISPDICEICKTNYNSDFVIIINRNVGNTIENNIINYERHVDLIERKNVKLKL